jgi:chromosome segregation ATPase
MRVAQREKSKAKRVKIDALDTARGIASVAKPVAASGDDLLREIEHLKSELANANAKIKALEEQRDQAANRIDWAIDSLHNLLEKSR